MNIYQRINAVMKKVEYVQKDVTVSGGGSYKAVSHDMVLSVLRRAMVEQGIVTRLEQSSGTMLQLRDKNNGINMHLYSADFSIHFVNMDEPQDFCTVCINAHAADTGDKAPGKAASYAVKYAMLKTFGLETGENDESRTAEPVRFTDIQKAEFDEFVENNDNGLGYLCFTKHVGPEVMEALNSSFEKGKISSGKETVRKLDREGWTVLKEAARQVDAHITSGDSSGLLEVIGEFANPIERKLLGGLLTPQQIKAIKDVQELSQ